MDILHLSEDEPDFGIKLRKESTSECRTRREKTGKLRAISEKEKSTMDIPDSADHVIEQAEHVYLCQRKLQDINQRLEKALEEENSIEVVRCRSKLLHYKSRLALITEQNFIIYAGKLERHVENSLRRTADFLGSMTLLDAP